MKDFYAYMMANRSKTLYVGVTSNLIKRVAEHKSKLIKVFTSKYNIDLLVYFEPTCSAEAAIAREKQLKGLSLG